MTSDEATSGIIKYWQIIVVIITMAAGYGSMSNKMNVMAEDVKEQKAETVAAQEQRTAVEKSVISITKDVESIKDKLGEQDKKFDKQDEKLDKIIDKLNES